MVSLAGDSPPTPHQPCTLGPALVGSGSLGPACPRCQASQLLRGWGWDDGLLGLGQLQGHRISASPHPAAPRDRQPQAVGIPRSNLRVPPIGIQGTWDAPSLPPPWLGISQLPDTGRRGEAGPSALGQWSLVPQKQRGQGQEGQVGVGVCTQGGPACQGPTQDPCQAGRGDLGQTLRGPPRREALGAPGRQCQPSMAPLCRVPPTYPLGRKKGTDSWGRFLLAGGRFLLRRPLLGAPASRPPRAPGVRA